MPKVLVTSDHSMGSTTVGVNGVNVKIPHNKVTPISDEHLEALQNAAQPRVTVKVIDDDVDADGEAEVLPAGTQLAGQAPETAQDPATPAAESDGTRAAELAAKNPAEVKPDPLAPVPELQQNPATPAAESEATSEETSKDSSEHTGMTAEQADAFVNRSIGAMEKEFAGVADGDIDAIISAEKRREAPDRSGVIKPLEARKAAAAKPE